MVKPSLAISLITPVRQAGDALRATLRSVARQTMPVAEHIIVDGCPGDAVSDICREYAERVHYPVIILRRKPVGVYDALNYGLLHAGGDIAGLLHGGDFFASDWVLERVAGVFAADSELELSYGDVAYFNSAGRVCRYYSGEEFRPGLLKWGFAFPHPSMYVRRRLFDRYGLYRTDYTAAGDFEWIVRVVLKEQIRSRYLPGCAVKMQCGGISTSLGHRLWLNPKEKLRALHDNGLRVCPLRILGRYFFLLTSLFKHKSNQNPV